jgi:hypothetical protein
LKPSHQIRKLSSSTVRSTTKRLPEWYRILEKLKLAKKTLPRDVPTRWNSTFRMLNTANEYRSAVDKLTSNRLMGLHKCEMTDDEFAINEELRDVLLVSDMSVTNSLTLTESLVVHALSLFWYVDFQRCNRVFLALNAQPPDGDPCHGHHR